uniref:Uncharacterized protein n=1 Tax=Caenorhabditis japonica TaxID=281687 RepID=A0A8R1IEN6_CAEJA
MVDEEKTVLPVGTEVSAKFKGAFCEARIKRVTRNLKVKVQLKEPPFGFIQAPCSDFPHNVKFEVNENTEVQVQRKPVRCTIVSVKDASVYLVG